MITVSEMGDKTAFGSSVISQGIFRWRIQMISAGVGDTETSSFIGIIVDDEETLVGYNDDLNWHRTGYQLCGSTGTLYCNYKESLNCISAGKYGCRFMAEGDILEITLDLNEYTLSFMLNDEDFGVAFKNITKRNYRLAWSSFNAMGATFLLL